MKPVSVSALPAAILIAWFGTTSVLAHHSPAAFDMTTFTVIEGTIVDFKWGNPHVYFAVETTGPGGKRYVQQIESASVAQLLSRGVTRNLLHAGDRVSVRANPNRDGPGHTVLGVELTTADGSRFPLAAGTLRALGPGESIATSVAGTWVPAPEGFGALAVAIRSWPKTELAKKVLAGDRSDLRADVAECIPAGPPFLMAASVPITVSTDRETATFDIDDVAGAQTRRVVHLGAKHPADIKPTLLGHSTGIWEGTALIVDTVGFNPQPGGMGFEFPSSKAKHIVERFSLSEDRKHLDYEIRIEDYAYLKVPVTYRTSWDYRPEQKPSNAPCDKTVARRFLKNE